MQQVTISLSKDELQDLIMNAVEEVLDKRSQIPKYYTADEVVTILSISKMTLHRYRKKGLLRAITVNRCTRYSKEEIDLLIDRSMEGGAHVK